MPAEVETMMSTNGEVPWHGLGRVIADRAVRAKRALKLAGLNWQVTKVPLLGVYTDPVSGEEIEIDVPSRMAVIRLDTLAALGVVGLDYRAVQNEELLDFAEAVQDSDEALITTAGSLLNGKLVWVTCLLDKEVKIAGMEDERIDPYMMFTNSHDGTRALTGVMTPIRTVCMNTWNLAMRSAMSTWSVRHTSGLDGRLQEARQALGIAFKYLDRFEELGNSLVKQRITKKDFGAFLEQLMPYDETMLATINAGDPSRAARNVDEAREAVRSLFLDSPNLENVRGTRWAALNAVGEYVDHVKVQRTVLDEHNAPDERAMAERRFIRIVWQADLKQKALGLLAPDQVHRSGDNWAVVRELEAA